MSHSSESTKLFYKNSLRPTVGIIRNNRVNYREMLQNEGLKLAAKENDVNLIIYSGGQINFHEESESTAIYDFVDKNKLDGLIIWTGNINWLSSPEETESFVYKYNYIPLISLETKIDGVDSIIWDDFNAMKDALIHLIEVHKYRRIAFIRGVRSHFGVEQRYKAYIHILNEYGIPIDEDIIFDDLLYHNDEGVRKLESLWMSGIDAIVAYNDMNARFVSTLMEKKNLPFIPIVGFDDEVDGETDKPNLTTVHPPFYELGCRAIEVILAKIKGIEVPELEVLPCRLIVRKSCGCTSGSFMKEDIFREKIDIQEIPEIIKNKTEVEMVKYVKSVVDIPEHIDISWVPNLLSVFFDGIKMGDDRTFINLLERLLLESFKQNNSLDVFQDIILLLHYFTDLFLEGSRVSYTKAQNVLSRATNLIAEMQISYEINKRLQGEQRYYYLISFKHIISNAVDMNDLVKRIMSGFKMIGISSCYISLYENISVSTEKARLILAYNEQACIDINQVNSIFPSVQLVPDGILSYDERFELILKPLYFHKRQIGFALFGDTLKDSSEYEQLSEIISTAINGVMLIEDMANKALELKETNNELEEAYSSLKENQQKLLVSEKMASLGRLTAGIAHEMNTPLAAVRTSLKELEELVNEYDKSIENLNVLPDDHKSIAQDMMRFSNFATQAAEKSAGFIRGIKAQTININLSNWQVFNVSDVLSDALSVLDFVVKKENCSLITNYDNSIRLYGDPKRFVQVITNLVINSIDACKPNGGDISVTLKNNGDGFAKLTVQDTGCGIPKENLSRIFDSMFTTKPFGEGTGLGLSIVKELVNEFKGSIDVESKRGLTTFVISLPI